MGAKPNETNGVFGTCNSDGSKKRGIVTFGSEGTRVPSWYAWAPDGSRLAYLIVSPAGDGSTDELRTVSSDGTDDALVARGFLRTFHVLAAGAALSEFEFEPAAWSPDSTRIAFATSPSQTETNVVIARSAGRNAGEAENDVVLVETDFSLRSLGWAATGDHVAVADARRLVVRPADGSSRAVLVATPDFDHRHWAGWSWSPVGRRIAFWVRDLDMRGPDELRVATADGSAIVVASFPQPASAVAPTVRFRGWHPTGDWLIYGVPQAGASEVHIVRADGREDRVMASGESVSQGRWNAASDGLLLSVSRGTHASLQFVGLDGDVRAEFDVEQGSQFGWGRGDRIVYWTTESLRVRHQDGSAEKTLWSGPIGQVELQ